MLEARMHHFNQLNEIRRDGSRALMPGSNAGMQIRVKAVVARIMNLF
jgi:hypothetical protein